MASLKNGTTLFSTKPPRGNATEVVYITHEDVTELTIIVWTVGGVLLITLLALLGRIILARRKDPFEQMGYQRHRNNVFRIRVDSEYFAHDIGSSFSVPHDTTELVTDTSASTLSSPTDSPTSQRTHSRNSTSSSNFRTCGLPENIESVQRTNTETAACDNYTSGLTRANDVVSSNVTRAVSQANSASLGETLASGACSSVTRDNSVSSGETLASGARSSVTPDNGASSGETRVSGSCSGLTRANGASSGETRANGASSGLITFKHSQINTQNINEQRVTSSVPTINHQLSINLSTSNPCPNVTNSSGLRQQENSECQRGQSTQNSVTPSQSTQNSIISSATDRQLPVSTITGSHATLSNGVVISPPPYCDVISTSARLPSVVVSRPERPQARRILFSL